MKRVWQGLVGLAISSVWATGCLAVYDWDFQAGSGGAGTGGDGGNGGASTGTGGNTSTVSTSSSGAGGSMNTCPGCTWGRRFGDDAEQIGFNMALANDGSLFLVGSHKGTIALDGANVINYSAPMGNQPFLVKFNQVGVSEWITQPLDYQSAEGNGSEIDLVGNVFAWLGTITNGASGTDTFVEMRDVTGGRDVTRWRKVFGSTMNDGLRSVAISPDGTRVYVAGAIHNQNLSFANCPALTPFDSTGNQNIVVLALDAQNGNCLWGKSWGGGHHLGGSISVTIGTDGSPFVSGHVYSGTITTKENIPFPQAPPQDPNGIKYRALGFVFKLNAADGGMLAGRGYVDAAFISLAADRSTGTIMASGGIGGNIQFLGQQQVGAVVASDGADAAVLAFDENLNEKWGHFWAGSQNQFCFSIESDQNGRAYAACTTRGKIDTESVVNCATDKNCSVLFPLQSANGTILGNQIKTFGETQSQTNMGLTFFTAATPSALAVAGSWTAPVRFWDDTLLDATGSVGDFDIAVGKVEPLP